MTEDVSLPELLNDQCGSRDEQAVPATAALATADHLRQFYRELEAWIEGGLKEDGTFDPLVGLCGNIEYWARDNDADLYDLGERLGSSFRAAGLSTFIPFNPSFSDWCNEYEVYENPARLAWIKARAAGEPIVPALGEGAGQ